MSYRSPNIFDLYLFALPINIPRPILFLMETRHTAILYRKDNLCHIFHNEHFCIMFDVAEPEILYAAATTKVLEKNFYKTKEISQLENLAEPRKVLCAYTTHHHEDHSGGNKFMLQKNLNVVAGDSLIANYIKKPAASIYVCENFSKPHLIPELRLKIINIFTPCHTKDSYCYYVSINDTKRFLVTGDTFFYLFVGKFFEGTADQMAANIIKVLKNVQDDTVLLYGHDYRQRNLAFLNSQGIFPSEDIKSKMFLELSQEKIFNPCFKDFLGEGNPKAVENLHKLRNEKDEVN